MGFKCCPEYPICIPCILWDRQNGNKGLELCKQLQNLFTLLAFLRTVQQLAPRDNGYRCIARLKFLETLQYVPGSLALDVDADIGIQQKTSLHHNPSRC